MLFNSYVTGADGRIEISGLEHGSYYFVEAIAPSDQLLNTSKINFEIVQNEDGTTSPVSLKTENYKGKVSLTKSDEHLLPLEGVVFDLYYIDQIHSQGLMTDEHGTIFVSDLAPGSYYFKEVSSVGGRIINTELVPFEIQSEFEGRPDEVEITNVINYFGSFQMKKIDENGNPLMGVIFELKDPNGSITSLISDHEGIISLDGLVVGEYILTEMQTLDGYQLDSNPISFIVGAEFDGQPQTIKLEDFINESLKTSEPSEPLEPLEPSQPDNPESSVEPEEPGVPVTPIDPISPIVPELPVEVVPPVFTTPWLPATGIASPLSIGYLIIALGAVIILVHYKRKK